MPKNGVKSGRSPLFTPFFGTNPLQLRNSYIIQLYNMHQDGNPSYGTSHESRETKQAYLYRCVDLSKL